MSVDVSAVAYYRVVDATKSVVAIENVAAAINQIAQTTLREVVGQHRLDETLAETDRINVNIREILDVATEEWGVVVTLVELKDIQLPESMKRAMARQAEAEREKLVGSDHSRELDRVLRVRADGETHPARPAIEGAGHRLGHEVIDGFDVASGASHDLGGDMTVEAPDLLEHGHLVVGRERAGER